MANIIHDHGYDENHDSYMNIHDEKQHAMLEVFSESVITYVILQIKLIISFRVGQILFTEMFPVKIWETNEIKTL